MRISATSAGAQNCFSVAYMAMTLRRYLGNCGKQLRRTSFSTSNRARCLSHVTPLYNEDGLAGPHLSISLSVCLTASLPLFGGVTEFLPAWQVLCIAATTCFQSVPLLVFEITS
jgi:hypothetical protein